MNDKHQHLTDEQEVEAVATVLAATDLSHRSQIRQSLRHRLIEQSHQKGQTTMLHRMWKPATALAAIALVAALALPSVRAFAQSLLVEVGIFTITDEKHDTEPVGFDPTAPTATPIDPATFSQPRVEELGGGMLHSNISVEEAQRLTGFDVVREPAYVPAGYTFELRAVYLAGAWDEVNWKYMNRNSSSVFEFDNLDIAQIRGEDGSTTMGVGPQATVVETEVNGLAATFIADAFVDFSDSQNPGVERLANMLIWDDGDYTFKIMSFELGQSEMLAIANSMYN